jgi:hypothetical protein
MKNLRKMLGVSALSVMVSLSACKKDDPKPEACENGTFKATVNGTTATGSSFNNTLVKAKAGATSAKRMDIRATDAEGRQLIITISDQTAGTNGDGVSTDPYIPFEDVTTGTENTFFFTIIEDGVSYLFSDGNLDITSCDASAKKVSGTFSFSDEDFQVTNGSFTNMCYTVLQ